MKAFAYLRVSGKSQIEGDGFPRQRKAVSSVKGYEITREFVEPGLSGESAWDKRPAFQEMLDAILDNGVRTIIVENLTRLARAYTIQEAILVFLASKNITLISADTGEDVTAALHGDPMKKALIQMQAVFSELDKNSLVRKLKAARARKRQETGCCEGRKPFGYTPEERATLDRMHELRRKPRGKDAMSYGKIAKTLDAEGRLSRSGKPWTTQSVRIILTRGKTSSKPSDAVTLLSPDDI